MEKSGQKLKICYEYMNRGDRWMQVCAKELFISLFFDLKKKCISLCKFQLQTVELNIDRIAGFAVLFKYTCKQFN